MRSERDPEEVLQDMAEHAERTGRLAAAADIRRRGDTIRRRRHVTSAALSVVLIGVVGAGVAAIQFNRAAQPLPIGPAGPTSTVVAPTGSPDVSPDSSPNASPDGSPIGVPASSDDPLVSGQRQVAIVRTDAFESAVSLLDEGRLGEVDGVEGRRLFVIEPQDQNTFLVRAAEPNPDGSDACWQVVSSGSDPLTVGAAVCAADDSRQRFAIAVVEGQGEDSVYAISSNSAYLQNSSTRGLILEELGDATLTTFFRLVDNGSAPR
ncbi:hypothetical protein [Micromonospora sp. NBC_01813]|uniref:hypothetical protein n=1 Tax=Micromonospora sp. NBC_01813 TaxID=2975988 RepID=UPI002DD924DD|nr:hypothetical protein [Micromonospora sp. NBC_01813]WSA09653.1 hypothetical protein OG958_02180 [Micromonospora sp. NBC_01813]